jgi:hypothetical protein
MEMQAPAVLADIMEVLLGVMAAEDFLVATDQGNPMETGLKLQTDIAF